MEGGEPAQDDVGEIGQTEKCRKTAGLSPAIWDYDFNADIGAPKLM
jgi:hypothetical protein